MSEILNRLSRNVSTSIKNSLYVRLKERNIKLSVALETGANKLLNANEEEYSTEELKLKFIKLQNLLNEKNELIAELEKRKNK